MHRIVEGNSFELVIIGQEKTGGTVENIDLSPVDELAVYLVKAGRGRKLMAYTINEAGEIVMSVDAAEVSKGIYGVEVIGKIEDTAIHAQQPSAFQIVDGYHRFGDAGAVMSYEVNIVMIVNTAANKRYVDAAVAAEAEARQAADEALGGRIDNAGKVDDVLIDGVSILDPDTKKANIPTSMFGKVDDVKVNDVSVLDPETKEANINITASVVADDEPGTPTANATMQDGNINIEFAHVKGEKGDKGDTGSKGDQGDSAVFNPETGNILATLHNTLGDDDANAMTQRAVTEEIEKIGMVSTATPADFEIADENGNAIISVNNGHIKTKHFNSQDIPDIGESDIVESDFALGDGNTDILRIHKGHLYTKNFNSEQVLNDMEILKEERAKFAGKRIAIIGDSISTYQGWLPSDLPDYDGETYANYYPAHGYDVNDVSKTWWHIAASKLGILPENIRNCAWSGSKLTGDSTSTTDASAGCSSRRIADLGIGGAPDIVVIFISCNDFGQNVEVGDWQVNEAIPSEGQITTLREAYALMLSKIITAYPNARIFCCTILDERQRDKTPGWPTNNSVGVSTAEWNRNIAEIANAFGCDIINIHSCGMNYINISGYTCEPSIDNKLHPNAAGMRLIGNRVYNEIKNKY